MQRGLLRLFDIPLSIGLQGRKGIINKMSWLSAFINRAGTRIIHVPEAELPAYVQEANDLFNPTGDPSLPLITGAMWRCMEQSFVMGVQASAERQILGGVLHQVVPAGLQGVADAVVPAIVAPFAQTVMRPVPVDPRPLPVPPLLPPQNLPGAV
jgi:hypothetical protein